MSFYRLNSIHAPQFADRKSTLHVKSRKTCQIRQWFSVWQWAMPTSFLTCASCGKTNVEGGRYCINCGAILNPIYCSSCGTKNPDGLERCLECGSSMPSLAGLRWIPVVTVLKPTSAMSEGKYPNPTESTVGNSGLKWFRGRRDRRKRAREASQAFANNHT